MMKRLRRAIVVVGKPPEAGVTKTRLSPPLTHSQAAELYAAFLVDCVELALRAGWDRVSVIYPPRRGARASLRDLLPPEVRLVAQAGSGLQGALTDAFERDLRAGFGQVVLIGSDNPSLPPETLEQASRGLTSSDVVIGPSEDGGYYLIGMTAPHRGLFERITWSTDVVFDETLERAATLRLSVATLPRWYDVDTVEGFRRLVSDLEVLPSHAASATRATLARISGTDPRGPSAWLAE